MIKVRRISSFQHSFSFHKQQEEFDFFFERFLQSDLGKIYTATPWADLVKDFRLKIYSKGPTAIFSPRGKIALMFLKHYFACSDHKLLEIINGSLDCQFFCDIYLERSRLKNAKIISEIRCELAGNLDIDKVQNSFYLHWSPYIKTPNFITTDATCYESSLRYPTDVKLLWECVSWIHKELKIICDFLEIPLPRTKYKKWEKRYVSYSKMRKKTKKRRIPLNRALLHLLNKLSGLLDDLEEGTVVEMPKRYYKRRATIRKIQDQQFDFFKTGVYPKDRIVSIDKDYLRPIKRGKERNKTEFGAKVNKFQIDGINFIERLSFESFNEGTGFENTIRKAELLTKVKVKKVGADGIYATNTNRKFAASKEIITDFKPKGKRPKDAKEKKKVRKSIRKERATRLEGSFGKEKQFYHLKKIKARTEATERLWIFFGIHTANALEIGRRMHQNQKAAA